MPPRKKPKKSKSRKSLKCNKPVKSYKPGKKRMVRACSKGKEKLIHFGATGYKHNYSAKARRNFRSRHKCSTAKDKLTARYWACKNLWTKGGDKLTRADKSKRLSFTKRRSTSRRKSERKSRRKSRRKSPRKSRRKSKSKSSRKSVPTNKALYNRVKAEAKRKFKVWPSAYGSGWLVKTYKSRGGKYKTVSTKKSRRKSRKPSRRRSKSRRKSRNSRRRSKSRRKSRKPSRRRSKSRRKSRKPSRRRSYRKRSSAPRKRSKRRSKSKSKRRSKKKSRRSGGLSRWFDEEWINVCKLPKIVPCGRSKAKWKNYPYCRPRKRINKSTPKTARELSKAEIKRRCRTKRRSPKKRVYGRKKSK